MAISFCFYYRTNKSGTLGNNVYVSNIEVTLVCAYEHLYASS